MTLDAPTGTAEHGAVDSITQPTSSTSTEGRTAASLALWRALALGLAALVAALVFAAYTQPELLLNYSGLRFCG